VQQEEKQDEVGGQVSSNGNLEEVARDLVPFGLICLFCLYAFGYLLPLVRQFVQQFSVEFAKALAAGIVAGMGSILYYLWKRIDLWWSNRKKVPIGFRHPN
jgi:hypothetical protein